MSATTTSSAINAEQIARLLAAARETIASVRYCWVASRAEDGGANARAVRSFAGRPGEDEWTRRFTCRRGSRKVNEIRRDPLVTLAYQDDSGDAFVALGGRATLIDDPLQVRELWPQSASAFFPDRFAETTMIVVRIEVDRIEIHARGITAEPFGHGRTLIKRDAAGLWFFVPANA
jgi:general stress protein 26